MTLPSDYTQIKWDIVKVVSLPNGVKLPDFYFDHMDKLTEKNFCLTKRFLVNEETTQQIKDNIDKLPDEYQ